MSFETELKWDERGLIPAIVQDADSGQVLMMAWMNAEALKLTLESGQTWFWSRSRGELWHKGATSGNVQQVVEVRYDCDGDALLVRVHPAGPACHTGEQTCFYRALERPQEPASERPTQDSEHPPFSLQFLYDLIVSRRDHPSAGSYTASLFTQGEPKIAQKVGEEATEVIVAALAQSGPRLIEECADLTYHTLVLLAAKQIAPAQILAELERRHR